MLGSSATSIPPTYALSPTFRVTKPGAGMRLMTSRPSILPVGKPRLIAVGTVPDASNMILSARTSHPPAQETEVASISPTGPNGVRGRGDQTRGGSADGAAVIEPVAVTENGWVP